MTATETIFQCTKCLRFFDAEKNLLAQRILICVPEIFDCAEPDCAEVLARRVRADELKRQARRDRIRGVRFASAPSPKFVRSSCPPEREYAVQLPISPPQSPADLESDFQASGAADSANKILLEFFRDPKNFNKPFRSTDLETLTAQAGHPSSRMNNRAIWLREQFIPAGLYLDNDPSGQKWSLPNGSYYKLCRIEHATSLSETKKYSLTHPEPEML